MRLHLAATALVLLGGLASAEDTATWRKWGEDRVEELLRQGLNEQAVEECLVLAQLAPKDPRPLVRAALIAVETPVVQGKELAPNTDMFIMAEHCVRDAIARWGQGDPTLAYVIGRLRYAERQWSSAWRMFVEAKDRGFDPPVVRYWQYRAGVNRAKLLIDSGRGAEAAADLEALRAAMPQHPERRALLIDLAAAHHNMQEPEVAIQLLEQVLADAPDTPDAHYLWGMVLRDKGDLEGAEAHFRDAMRQAASGFAQETYKNSLLRIAEVEIKLNRLDEAEQVTRQYLEVAKDDPEGLFALGRVEQARGNLEKAVPIFRRVVRLMPNAFDTLLALKQVLYQLNETKEADQVGERIQQILKRREADLQGR